jgi:pyruvate formate lyase activating enzyme
VGLGTLGAGAAAVYCALRSGGLAAAATSTDVFKNDAPKGELWDQWQRRGWAVEGRHHLKLARNVQCRLCPNECLLEPEDRGRCRNRVNKDGTLYTLAYGNACSFGMDPIEKKPLFHFLPGTDVFSFATAGCGFRCLNCQNWEISQCRPEENKDPGGESVRLNPETLGSLSLADRDRLSLFPEDIVALCEYLDSPSVAYTYSEPSVWFEYMIDTARLARAKGIKNVWVTCGYIQQEPLLELCPYLDAANVDLKSFDPKVYGQLNSGKLEPVLETLRTLKQKGVWFEVTNLIVPTYTDNLDTIRRMCHWLVDNLGPDYPLHFSRFHPAHKLTHLPPTPIDALIRARSVARECGLRYVYLGNVRGVEGAETTICPNCGRMVIDRDIYFVTTTNLSRGACNSCGATIAGVWKA